MDGFPPQQIVQTMLVPLMGHAVLAFLQSFKRTDNHYQDLEELQIQQLPSDLTVEGLLGKSLGGHFSVRDVLSAVFVWSRRLRRMGMAPVILYLVFVLYVLFGERFRAALKVELEPDFWIYLFLFAAFFHISYVFLKFYSKIPDLLQRFHGRYSSAGLVAIGFDFVPLVRLPGAAPVMARTLVENDDAAAPPSRDAAPAPAETPTPETDEVRQVSVVVVADVKGYSALVNRDQDWTLKEWEKIIRGRVVPIVTSKGGEVVKETGDGFIAVFSLPSSGLDAAVTLQKGMRESQRRVGAEWRIDLRIGIDVGEVVVTDDPASNQRDVFGNTVIAAARLEGESPPGGICVSDSLYQMISPGSEREIFEDLGPVKLRGPGLRHAYSLPPEALDKL